MSHACGCSVAIYCFAWGTEHRLRDSAATTSCCRLPSKNGRTGVGQRQLQQSSNKLRPQPRRLRRLSSLIVAVAGEDSQDGAGKDAPGKQVDGGGAAAAAVETKFSSGAGFGASSSPPKSSGKSSKSKKLGPAPRQPPSPGPVRRTPPAKALLGAQQEQQQALQVETAIVVSLGFLGILILVEGLVLAASGLLPEEWDGFLVNVLYPSYTPTVGVFLLGAAGYGLFKYLGFRK